jgi:hypothetical protein
MRRILFYMLLGASLAVFAQQQFFQSEAPQGGDEPAAAGNPEGGQDAENEPGDDAGPDASGVPPDAGGAGAAPGAVIEADGVQAEDGVADAANEEFEPDEEISEDYPVPLPSDI